MGKYEADFEKPLARLENRLLELKRNPSASRPDIAKEISRLEEQLHQAMERAYSNLTPIQRVQLARNPERPGTDDYVAQLIDRFQEIKGDRHFSEDPAIVAGLGWLAGRPVALVGNRKGTGAKDRAELNFGMASPEGYRKAARVYRLAEKFSLPVISLIDTPGAFPGIEAEERGQAWAIAENLALLSSLATPLLAVNIGEGGSGGALALGVADRVLMLENAYYSVISPEGCASIIYNDSGRAGEAAQALKLTAGDLLGLGLIDEVVSEPLGGAHHDADKAIAGVGAALEKAIRRVSIDSPESLVKKRKERLRAYGVFEDRQVDLIGSATSEVVRGIGGMIDFVRERAGGRGSSKHSRPN